LRGTFGFINLILGLGFSMLFFVPRMIIDFEIRIFVSMKVYLLIIAGDFYYFDSEESLFFRLLDFLNETLSFISIAM